MQPLHDKWQTIDELAVYLKMGRTKLNSQWHFDRDEIKSGRAAKREIKLDERL